MKKIDNLKDMEIWGDITFYFQENINNKRLYKKALSDYRLSRNRAIERARKAEEENEKLRKQNESLSI